MYTALYRTERPEVFGDVLGQEHIVRILKNQLEKGTVGHAYLFCGTRGTGKTSIARILAKGVNCTSDGEAPCGTCPNCLAIKNGTFPDMIEIDAASNNSVDNVRELRESVNYPPAVGRRKVYIIDEAHMLSTAALNALLKTLEEPPEDVMFILATTDPQKLLQTIVSRCLRLDFRRVSEEEIAGRMERICSARGIDVTDDALKLLAANADGSVRDGLSLLDQCLAGTDRTLDRDDVLEYLGTAGEEFFIKLTDMIIENDSGGALLLLDDALRDGKDVKQLLADWLSHYRSLLIGKYVKEPEAILNMSRENIGRLKAQSAKMQLSDINDAIITVAKSLNDARYSTQPRTLMELAIVMLSSGITENVGAAVQVRKTPKSADEGLKHKPAEKPNTAEIKAESIPANIQQPKSQLDEGDLGASAAKPDPSAELSDTWNGVCRILSAEGGAVTMICTGTTLADMNDREFKLIATSELTKSFAEKNSKLITDAFEKETGKRLSMVCRLQDAAKGDDSPTASEEDMAKNTEDIVSTLASKYNLNVRIEDN